MELTKAEKRQLQGVIQRGVLRRCEEWLRETAAIINREYEGEENAFDRCMEITKRSHNFYKEAARRENYYRNTMLLSGVGELLTNGYLAMDDLKDFRPEVQAAIRLWARLDD